MLFARGFKKFVFSSGSVIICFNCDGKGPFFFLHFPPLLIEAVENTLNSKRKKQTNKQQIGKCENEKTKKKDGGRGKAKSISKDYCWTE